MQMKQELERNEQKGLGEVGEEEEEVLVTCDWTSEGWKHAERARLFSLYLFRANTHLSLPSQVHFLGTLSNPEFAPPPRNIPE